MKNLRSVYDGEATMFRSRRLLGSAALCSLALAFAVLPERAASGSPAGQGTPQSGTTEPVPAYHNQASPAALPATLNPDFFRGDWQSVDLSKYQKPLPAK